MIVDDGAAAVRAEHPMFRLALRLLRSVPRTRGLSLMLLVLGSSPALAGNGLTVTGFGAASAGMAGVDLAVSNDVTSLNTNPAGLAHLQGPALDVYLEPFLAVDNVHSDPYNGKHALDNPIGSVFGGGYAAPLLNGKVVAGIGLFAQGGVGFIYKDLTTKYGTRDDANAVFGVFKLTPGLAWNVNDKLRLGAVLGIAYGQARQKLFPNTSVAQDPDTQQPFFGSRFDSGTALGFNGKFGVQYQPSDALTLALVYTSPTPLQLKHARVTVNFDAINMGKVVYRDAEQKGLAFPEEVGVGASYRFNPRWLLAAEANWMHNSASLREVRLTASNPDGPVPPGAESLSSTQALNWRDQYVFGIAGEYQYDQQTVLRAGYSHSHNQIPHRNLSPLLALITEDEVTVGFARQLNAKWAISSGLEWQLPKKEIYTNADPSLPFGSNNSETNEVLLLTLMVSRRW